MDISSSDHVASGFHSDMTQRSLQCSEILKLISNFLLSSDFLDSWEALQKKTNFPADPILVSRDVRNAVISGDWDKVISLLTNMVDDLVLRNEEVTLIKDILTNVVHEQNYLELVNHDKWTEAVTLLRTKLASPNSSGVSPSRNVETLCLLLVELDKSKWHSKLNWCSEEYSSRLELLNHIRFLCHTFLYRGLPPTRLSDLLDMGIRQEISHCVIPHHHHQNQHYYPLSVADENVHYSVAEECTKRRFPSQVSVTYNQWQFFQCIFSPRGKYLAALAQPNLVCNENDTVSHSNSTSGVSAISGHYVLLIFTRSNDFGSSTRNGITSVTNTSPPATLNSPRSHRKWVLYKLKAFQDQSTPTAITMEWRFDEMKLILSSANYVFILSLPSLSMEQFPCPLRLENGDTLVTQLVPHTDILFLTSEDGHIQVMDTQWQQLRLENAITFRVKLFTSQLYHKISSDGEVSYYIRVFVTDFAHRVRCYTWNLNSTLEHRMSKRLLQQQCQYLNELEQQSVDCTAQMAVAHSPKHEDDEDEEQEVDDEEEEMFDNSASAPDLTSDFDRRVNYLRGSFPNLSDAMNALSPQYEHSRHPLESDADTFSRHRTLSSASLSNTHSTMTNIPHSRFLMSSASSSNSSQLLAASLIRVISSSTYPLTSSRLQTSVLTSNNLGTTSSRLRPSNMTNDLHPLTMIDFPAPRNFPSWMMDPSPSLTSMDGGIQRNTRVHRPYLLPRPDEIAAHTYRRGERNISPGISSASPTLTTNPSSDEILTCDVPSTQDFITAPTDILDLEVTADGQHLITLHSQCLRVWNANNGNLIRELLPETNEFNSNESKTIFEHQRICLCGAGSEYVAAISQDKQVLFWYIDSSRPIHKVALSLDRSLSPSGSDDALQEALMGPLREVTPSTVHDESSIISRNRAPSFLAWNPFEPALMAVVTKKHTLEFWSSLTWRDPPEKCFMKCMERHADKISLSKRSHPSPNTVPAKRSRLN